MKFKFTLKKPPLEPIKPIEKTLETAPETPSYYKGERDQFFPDNVDLEDYINEVVCKALYNEIMSSYKVGFNNTEDSTPDVLEVALNIDYLL